MQNTRNSQKSNPLFSLYKTHITDKSQTFGSGPYITYQKGKAGGTASSSCGWIQSLPNKKISGTGQKKEFGSSIQSGIQQRSELRNSMGFSGDQAVYIIKDPGKQHYSGGNM